MLAQSVWLWEQYARRYCPTSWLALSIGLQMITGCQAYSDSELIHEYRPDFGCELGSSITHYVFRDSVMSEHLHKENCEKTVGTEGRGIKYMAFEYRSTIVTMVFMPSETGRSVIKSTAMCDQGRCGMGSGLSLPAWKVRGTLALAHTVQDAMKRWTSSLIFGHQYFPCNSLRVLNRAGMPGWCEPTLLVYLAGEVVRTPCQMGRSLVVVVRYSPQSLCRCPTLWG